MCSKRSWALLNTARIERSKILSISRWFGAEKPHARIAGIQYAEALNVPGVERIFTARDIPGKNLIGIIKKDQPVLASDRVRYIGDPVALVAARSAEAAEEAAKRVFITYEDLPFISSPEEALQPYAPPIHEKGNLLLEYHVIKGDVQAGFKEADFIAEETYTTTWVEHAYLEPDAGIAYLDEEGRVTIVCPTQNVHYDQKDVASTLGVPLEKVRVIQSATGGGFGGRLDITVHCFLALAVYHLKKPVKMIYSREEVFQGTSKRHPLKIRYKSGAKRDGRLTAVEVDILGDSGAYASYGVAVCIRSAVHATGPYYVPNVKARSQMVYTNNPWGGAMRGFGVPQMAFAHESQMDLLAQGLGMDPLELRLKNAIQVGGETATGQTLTASVGIGETLRKVKDWRDREGFTREDPKRPYIKRGVGIGSMWYGIGNTGIANPCHRTDGDPSRRGNPAFDGGGRDRPGIGYRPSSDCLGSLGSQFKRGAPDPSRYGRDNRRRRYLRKPADLHLRQCDSQCD